MIDIIGLIPEAAKQRKMLADEYKKEREQTEPSIPYSDTTLKIILQHLEDLKKSSLRFDLPDQENEMQTALNGHKYLRALCDIKAILRGLERYGLDTWQDKSAQEMFNHIEERFYETIEGLGI